MKLINSRTKQEVKIGDMVTSFRGEQYEVLNWSKPQHAGSSGRMYVKGDLCQRELFPSVFNCEFVK
jgi:hypothetical protein